MDSYGIAAIIAAIAALVKATADLVEAIKSSGKRKKRK